MKIHPMNNDLMNGNIAELPWERLKEAIECEFHIGHDEEITEIKPTINGLRVRIEDIKN